MENKVVDVQFTGYEFIRLAEGIVIMLLLILWGLRIYPFSLDWLMLRMNDLSIAIAYSCKFKPDDTPTQPSSFKCVCFEGHAADLPNNDSSFVQRAREKRRCQIQ